MPGGVAFASVATALVPFSVAFAPMAFALVPLSVVFAPDINVRLRENRYYKLYSFLWRLRPSR